MSKREEIEKKIIETDHSDEVLHPDYKTILTAIDGLDDLKQSLSQIDDTDTVSSAELLNMLIDIDKAIKELEEQLFIKDGKYG